MAFGSTYICWSFRQQTKRNETKLEVQMICNKRFPLDENRFPIFATVRARESTKYIKSFMRVYQYRNGVSDIEYRVTFAKERRG